MTLDNLLRIGQLKRHTTDEAEIGHLLAAARRNLADARAENISTENRFDAAYKCIMQCAFSATSTPCCGCLPACSTPRAGRRPRCSSV